MPEIVAGLDAGQLAEKFLKTSRGHLGREHAERLQRAARDSFGPRAKSAALALEVRLFIQSIEFVEAQIAELDRRIRSLLPTRQDLLTTIPGIVPATAATIVAEVGDVSRFAAAKDPAKAVVALSGLDPRAADSGQRSVYRRMSKRGSPYPRQAFFRAESGASQHDPSPEALYRARLGEGKSHRVALNAVANKLSHIVHACLRDRRPYEASS